jgi:hypothetical protein
MQATAMCAGQPAVVLSADILHMILLKALYFNPDSHHWTNLALNQVLLPTS